MYNVRVCLLLLNASSSDVDYFHLMYIERHPPFYPVLFKIMLLILDTRLVDYRISEIHHS